MFLVLLSFFSFAAMASEKSLYDFSWLDQDKEIYVLQNRKFRKDGKFYLGGTLGKTLSGAFIDAYGGTARAGYFFHENWGIEGVFGKSQGEQNDTAKGVTEQGTVPYYRKIDTYMGGMLMWSPFYSKINTFNKIFYFDWMFGAGLASITTLDNRSKFDTPPSNSLTSQQQMGILWDTGFRFYINENWSLRMDVTGLTYQANKSKKPTGTTTTTTAKKLFTNYDLGLGLNYAF